MDSVELWKYSSDKVISLSQISVQGSREKYACKCDPLTPLPEELSIPH